jgi:enoyl-[acyl-carrier protein] reductase II
MRTRLTELLDIEHPVMLAGMGGVSYAPLVAAVSAAGGFGCLGASTMSAEGLVSEMAAVRSATDRPFGVDLLAVMGDELLRRVQVLIDGGASLFVAGLGVPTDAVDLCHKSGVLVASMCGKVSHAERAVASGCDLVVAQGTEAGGHTGQVATMPLVPQVVDAVGDRVPVVAAGGIFDGRGLAAALALGADGVWVGTRFIATPEARSVAGYKEALLAAGEDGTLITRAYSGKPMRVLRNDYTNHFVEHPEEIEPFPTQLRQSMSAGAWHLGGDERTVDIDLSKEGFPAGQGVGGIDRLVPTAELMTRFVAEADAALEKLSAIGADRGGRA